MSYGLGAAQTPTPPQSPIPPSPSVPHFTDGTPRFTGAMLCVSSPCARVQPRRVQKELRTEQPLGVGGMLLPHVLMMAHFRSLVLCLAMWHSEWGVLGGTRTFQQPASNLPGVKTPSVLSSVYAQSPWGRAPFLCTVFWSTLQPPSVQLLVSCPGSCLVATTPTHTKGVEQSGHFSAPNSKVAFP